MKILMRLLALTALTIPHWVSGQAPMRYIGTAENSQLPDSIARIELSLFSQSDTLSIGFLRIDPPLGGSGIAFSLPYADSMIIVSIAPTGDTIRWHSSASEGILGGQYSILGGGFRGQSGRWTLTPQPNPSQWLVAVPFLLGFAGVSFLFLLARNFQRRWWIWRLSHGPLASPTEAESLSGVGGWLGWHVLGIALIGVYSLITVREIGDQIGTGVWMLTDVISYVRPLLMLESAIHVFQLAAYSLGLYLVWKRRPETPLFFAVVFPVLLIYCLVDVAFTRDMAMQLGAKLGPDMGGAAASEIDKAGTSNLKLILFSFVWSIYWLRSKRVAEIFAPVGSRRPAVDNSVAPNSTKGPSQGRSERACPWCAESILSQARYCKHCHREVAPLVA
jgi:hypothetical protein